MTKQAGVLENTTTTKKMNMTEDMLIPTTRALSRQSLLQSTYSTLMGKTVVLQLVSDCFVFI